MLLPCRGRHGRALRAAVLALRLALGLVVALGGFPAPVAAGSAVETSSGNYVYDRTDVAYVAEGAPVRFRRTYNSGDFGLSGLGPGWTHNFNMHVTSPGPGTPDLIVIGSTGRRDRYHANPDGSFTPRPDMVVSLVRQADGSYVARQEDGAVWTFDGDGRLQQVDEPGGATFLVSQGPLGPTSVQLANGRVVLLFEYDASSHRLVSATDVPDPTIGAAAPRLVRYGYDAGSRLETVTDPEGQVTRFAYLPGTFRLASITDALGHAAVTLQYDDQGRVSARTDARNLSTGWWIGVQYTINADGSHSSEEHRIPSALAPSWPPVIRYDSDQLARLVRETILPGPDDTPEIVTFAYGAPGTPPQVSRIGSATILPPGAVPIAGLLAGLPARIGDPSSPMPQLTCPAPSPLPANSVALNLGSAASLPTLDRRLVPLSGLAQALSTALGRDLDAYGRLEWAWLPAGAWHFAYDNEDRPLRVESPPDRPGEAVRVATFRYDAVGNVTEARGPDGGIDTYAYDERDSLSEARWTTGAVAQYAYDDAGDLKEARYRPGDGSPEQVTSYRFDGIHRPRQMSTPTQTIVFGYDAAGTCTPHRLP